MEEGGWVVSLWNDRHFFQVENAENAREEACWALGVENTLVLSNFSLRGSSDHFQ